MEWGWKTGRLRDSGRRRSARPDALTGLLEVFENGRTLWRAIARRPVIGIELVAATLAQLGLGRNVTRDKAALDQPLGDRLRVALGDIGVSTYRRDEARESHDRKVSSKAVAGQCSAQASVSEFACRTRRRESGISVAPTQTLLAARARVSESKAGMDCTCP